MKEQEFIDRWLEEKPSYRRWGEFVVSQICHSLQTSGRELDGFLKIPAASRLKSEYSLLDKAFSRTDKNYNDPFNEIEDKVGCRFVVLLVEHVAEIVSIIEKNTNWKYKACRHFEKERDASPLLFTYQSVHYVVHPITDFEIEGVVVHSTVTCEIQIRTLLQHAYAELTHEELYKRKQIVEPAIHRTIARSMALIETTDDYFAEVTKNISKVKVSDEQVISDLDKIYYEKLSFHPSPTQKSTLIIIDSFRYLITKNTPSLIVRFLEKNQDIIFLVAEKRGSEHFYNYGIVLFLYWLVSRHTSKVLRDWPFDLSIVQKIASDIGVSLEE
jgi:ppGpp synthetase/RelA/SpoT-type nucleotidyltranferase